MIVLHFPGDVRAILVITPYRYTVAIITKASPLNKVMSVITKACFLTSYNSITSIKHTRITSDTVVTG